MKQSLSALFLSLLLLRLLCGCAGQSAPPPAQDKAAPARAQGADTAKDETDVLSPAEVPEAETVSEAPEEALPPEGGEAETAPEEAAPEAPVEEGLDVEAGAEESPASGELPPESAEEEITEGAPVYDYITEGEYQRFRETVPGIQPKGFRDFQETMQVSLDGTWFDPESGEAFRINDDGAFVYIPYLGLYGEGPFLWELEDRSEQGKCPKLSIHCFGEDGAALVYYIAGNTGDYFWCVSQQQVFYRQ